MNGAMRAVFAFCFLLGMSLALVAQNSQNQEAADDQVETIVSLENAWNQAETRHDVAAMSMLLADTFAYTDDDGSFMNRAQWLDHIKTQVDQYDLLANAGVKVQIYDNAAVVTGEYRERLRVRGKSVPQSGRFTDTWIRQSGGWKCVASQSTLISH